MFAAQRRGCIDLREACEDRHKRAAALFGCIVYSHACHLIAMHRRNHESMHGLFSNNKIVLALTWQRRIIHSRIPAFKRTLSRWPARLVRLDLFAADVGKPHKCDQ